VTNAVFGKADGAALLAERAPPLTGRECAVVGLVEERREGTGAPDKNNWAVVSSGRVEFGEYVAMAYNMSDGLVVG
jgi:hypothetical protein